MAVNDFYRLNCIWRQTGTENYAVNGFTYRATEPTIFDTQEQDLVEAFKLDVETLYNDIVHEDFQLVRYQVVPKPGGTVAYEVGAAVSGQQTGERLPSQIAGLISWRTGVPGRSGRGRTYLPPINEGSQSDGYMSTTYFDAVTAFATAAKEIGNHISTAVYELAVWSEKQGVGRVVTSFRVEALLASQRGRRA